jgi:hypothetical protein
MSRCLQIGPSRDSSHKGQPPRLARIAEFYGEVIRAKVSSAARAANPLLMPLVRDSCAMVLTRMSKGSALSGPFRAFWKKDQTPHVYAVCVWFRQRARQDSNL